MVSFPADVAFRKNHFFLGATMPLQVTCSSCATKLKVADNLAGRKVKCPKCGTVCPVPAPAAVGAAAQPMLAAPRPAPRAPEPVEVDESHLAATPEDSPLRLQSFEELEVPDPIREVLEGELTAREKILWMGRQSMKLAMSNARIGFYVGIVLLIVVAAGAVLGVVLGAPALVVWIPVGFLTLVGVLLLFAPTLVQKGEKFRPCYVVTNRRALVCVPFGGGGRADVRSYNGTRLLEMQRREWRRFPGCGDLIFEVEIHTTGGGPDLRPMRHGRTAGSRSREHTTKVYHGFMMIEHLIEVENLVREKLVNPLTS
jgi:hypothetical protein